MAKDSKGKAKAESRKWAQSQAENVAEYADKRSSRGARLTLLGAKEANKNPPPYPLRKEGEIRQNPQKKRAQSYGEAIAQRRFEVCNL